MLAIETTIADRALPQDANSWLRAGLSITYPQRHCVDGGYSKLFRNELVCLHVVHGEVW